MPSFSGSSRSRAIILKRIPEPSVGAFDDITKSKCVCFFVVLWSIYTLVAKTDLQLRGEPWRQFVLDFSQFIVISQ